MDIIEKAKDYAKIKFENESSGHDFYHTLRVYNMALNIAKKENADIFIVSLAALLHDVDDYKIFGGEVGQTENAEEFMNSQSIEKDVINAVCYVIKNMSYKGDDIVELETLEAKIVQDADRIDALGAIGIARTFTFGGSKGRPIYMPNNNPRDQMTEMEYVSNIGDSSINHFHEKLLKLEKLMNTETAKNIAKHRTEYIKGFLNEFLDEWEGEK